MNFAKRLLGTSEVESAHEVDALDTEFDLSPATVERDLDNYWRVLNKGYDLNKLKVIKTDKPNLEYRILYSAEGEHLFIVDDENHKLIGLVMFKKPSIRSVRPVARETHSKIRKAYQGQGLGFSVYSWYLESGGMLISGATQTPASNALWKKLGKTFDWFLLYAPKSGMLRYLGDGSQLTKDELQDKNVRLVLLGKGWDLNKFRARTQMRMT